MVSFLSRHKQDSFQSALDAALLLTLEPEVADKLKRTFQSALDAALLLT